MMIFFKKKARFFSVMVMFVLVSMAACFAEDVFVQPPHAEITKQQIDRLIEDVVPLIETLEKQVVLSQKNNYGKDIGALFLTIVGSFFVSLVARDELGHKIMEYFSLYEYQAVTQENLILSFQFRMKIFFCLLPICAAITSFILYQLMLKKPYLSEKEMAESIKKLQKLKTLLDSLESQSAQIS